MRYLIVHCWFSLAATILAGTFAPTSSVRGAEATEAANTVTHTALTVRPDGAVNVDLAKLYAPARVVYVSSGTRVFAPRMIDEDLRTAFRFPGNDLHPTVIVELAQTDQIHRVSAVYKAEGARLDVYLLNALPKHPRDLRSLKPIASIVDLANRSEAAAEFAPVDARYVAFQWTRQKSEGEQFHVTEISAFGMVALEQVPPVLAAPDVHVSGETVIDFSNNLGTQADPPIIASVSP